MTESKFSGGAIQLLEIQLTESVAACGCSDQRFIHNKPEGLRITDIGRGVLVERPGEADVLLYPAILKRAVSLVDIDMVKKEAPPPPAPPPPVVVAKPEPQPKPEPKPVAKPAVKGIKHSSR